MICLRTDLPKFQLPNHGDIKHQNRARIQFFRVPNSSAPGGINPIPDLAVTEIMDLINNIYFSEPEGAAAACPSQAGAPGSAKIRPPLTNKHSPNRLTIAPPASLLPLCLKQRQ